MEEADYFRGERAAWTRMLSECVRALGYDKAEKAAWILEREATVAVLRIVCEEHGDNSWPSHLNLADVVEKHLHRHLSSNDRTQPRGR